MLKNDAMKIGFGTWKLKNDEETTKIINNAISVGYQLIDTASSYLNEEAIGKAIAKNNNRENLFVSGKLWNADRENVVKACKQTIYNLQCDYLDCYLVHWPASKVLHQNWIEINNNVWHQMEELVKQGLVKNIGVSNFKVNQLEELMKEATIKPYINQIEYHPGYMQREIVDYCKENEIKVQAWSPLGSGRILKKQEIISTAERYDKTPAQLCLKWCIQNDVCPIVKSTEIENMKSNLAIDDFIISQQDMEYINNLPCLWYSGFDSETITIFG